jgi:flagellar motility protein MotE (MotC chaperone)/sporulation protein YlmC with PRC-barrel domain
MTTQTTFYFSQLSNRRVFSERGTELGKIQDFLIDLTPWSANTIEPVRPRVIAAKMKTASGIRTYDFSSFEIRKFKGSYRVVCHDVYEINVNSFQNSLWLKDWVLGKQIVDINDRKLVKVQDIRLVTIPSGTFAIAVDVGFEGFLRRWNLDQPILSLLDRFGMSIEDKLILWDDIEAVDYSRHNLKLTKSSSRLKTLHPSDLADIIEDLDKATRTYIFSSLDDEQAADVLEEMEPDAQVEILESLSKEKAADLLEKMPADEAADILDELEHTKVEELLNEMDKSSSEEVRELLEYPDKAVGSIMSTDFMTFDKNMTVNDVITVIRKEKPEPSYIHSIFIVDQTDKFLSAIPLAKLIVSEPTLTLKQIMQKNPVVVYDDDEIDTLAELVSKYNLHAVPVLNRSHELEGVVVIEDIVHDLMGERKTK